MSKDITPSCPRSGTVPDCPVQGHVPSKYQHCLQGYSSICLCYLAMIITYAFIYIRVINTV